jgi:hypothetical protein
MNQMEKRRHPRVPVRTSAFLFDRRPSQDRWSASRSPLGRFEVVNVSVGGALIEGEIHMPVGTPVGIHLHLPGTEVQMGSVVVRQESPRNNRSAFAVSFDVVPVRDGEAVKKALARVLEENRNRATQSLTPKYIRACTDPDGHLMTPSGAAWYTLRELEAVHTQDCKRCQYAFAAKADGMTETCPHGQDLRALLRALTLVLADPAQYPRDLADCRALAIDWLGRDLDGKTRQVLRFRLDETASQALSGRAAVGKVALRRA